jgi:ATP-binding cassette subfamily B protein
MLYLIFRQEIQIGQFFALMIYSFFIFTPLQELGNVINIYRETEVSLAEFSGNPRYSSRPQTGGSGAGG